MIEVTNGFSGMKNECDNEGPRRPCDKGVSKVRKKDVMGFFRAVFSTAFFIGLFGVIGYLIQMTLL